VGEYSTDTSGNYLLSIRLDDIMIEKSPFDVRAAEGPMSILHSWAKGDGLVGAAAGMCCCSLSTPPPQLLPLYFIHLTVAAIA
jgi:hypothetical protein